MKLLAVSSVRPLSPAPLRCAGRTARSTCGWTTSPSRTPRAPRTRRSTRTSTAPPTRLRRPRHRSRMLGALYNSIPPSCDGCLNFRNSSDVFGLFRGSLECVGLLRRIVDLHGIRLLHAVRGVTARNSGGERCSPTWRRASAARPTCSASSSSTSPTPGTPFATRACSCRTPNSTWDLLHKSPTEGGRNSGAGTAW